MFFKQLATREASLSYFFGCIGHRKAIAVDVVAGDEQWFIDQAQALGVEIAYVVDTHVHADHYSGGRALAARVGAPYCLHEAARDLVRFDFTQLHDGQELDAGNVRATVLHTPGHTLDSLCLLVKDMRRGDEPWFVVTGDTLFVGAVGRPDLAGRETEMAALFTTACTPNCCPCRATLNCSRATRRAARAERACRASPRPRWVSRNAGIPHCPWTRPGSSPP